MQNTRFKIVLLACLFASRPLRAGTALHFLSHGPSAAAFGRGETGTVAYDDALSMHYNPALLTETQQHCISFSHFPLYDGTQYNYAAFSQHISSSFAVALSIINLKSGDIELRQKIDDTPSVTQTNHWAYQLSTAKHFDGFATPIDLGISFKYVYEEIERAKGGAYGIDLGILKTFNGLNICNTTSRMRLGIAAQNLLPPRLTLASEEETLGTYYRAGASLTVPVYYRLHSFDSLSAYLDGLYADNSFFYSEGLEYNFLENYTVRTGYLKDHPSAGFGYHSSAIRIDYAADFNPLNIGNRFSISYCWDSTQTVPPEIGQTSQINPGKDSLMREARQSLITEKRRQKERDKEVMPLFRAARKNYQNKRFLSAADQFRDILLRYPEYDTARLYHDRIASEMCALSSTTYAADFESLSYARGYMAYRNQDYGNALNEWEKVLQINPERDEIITYGSRVRTYLKDSEQRMKEKRAAEKLNNIFDDAKNEYEKRHWIPAIKKMELVQSLCRTEPCLDSVEWHKQAQEYIELSVQELSRSLTKLSPKRPQKAETTTVETDPQGAEKKYNEGLILYAQGKIAEAIRAWEISIRLDPGFDKAHKALQRAQVELVPQAKQ